MRALRLILLAACLLVAWPGCSQSQRSPDEVILWTGFESELPTLIRLANEFSAQSGKKVRVVKVPFQRLRDKYLIAAPAGQGPDLLIGPQDWVGILKTAGLLEPLPPEVLPRSEEFLPVTIEALTFQGQLYAVPLVAQCVALIRNPELIPRSPANLEEMVRLAGELPPQPGRYGIYWELKDLYFTWPIFATHGAYLFGTRDGQLNPEDLGLDNPGAQKAGDFLRRLTAEGLVPSDATTDLARSLYLERRAAMTVNGPWFLKDLRQAGVPYVIEPVPGLGEDPAPCLVTVEGVMLNNRAVARQASLDFLKFLATPQVQVEIALASGRPPANRLALEQAGRDPQVGPDLLAFARVVEAGIPMPNHPAVSAVWEDMKQTVELITKGEVQSSVQLPLTRQRIQKRIRQMME